MGNTAQCCYRREDEDEGQCKAMRCESWHSLPDVTEEQWHFFQRMDDLANMETEETIPEEPEEHEESTGATFEPFGGGASVPGLTDDQGSDNVVPEKARAQAVLPLKRRSSTGHDPVSRAHTLIKLRQGTRSLALVPEEALANIRLLPTHGPAMSPVTRSENEAYLPFVEEFREKVKKMWDKKMEHVDQLDEKVQQHLKDGCDEYEAWTDDATCLRMLRAVLGDQEAAAPMLVKAIECRIRDRDLYSTLLCEVHCDIRIIGRDLQHRPVVYMCSKNQTRSLKECGDQVLLAFEAAVRLSDHEGVGNGKVLFIADMYGFATSLNMDPFTFKELGGTFGSVFADRFAYILIVDFSFLAQSMWSMCKPLISERTQKKINFVGIKEAKDICKERLCGPTLDRVISAFDINRARGITAQEREDHARRTAICDVPLGLLRAADLAG